jgi:hypothetical protein
VFAVKNLFLFSFLFEMQGSIVQILNKWDREIIYSSTNKGS